MHERAALHHREDRLVDGRRVLSLAQDHAAAWAAQDLVGGEGDDVGVRHGTGDRLARHEADEVGGVHHEDRPDLVSDLAEGGEIDEAGVRRRSSDDHPRLVLQRDRADLVVVDGLGVLAHAVGHDLEPLAGEVDLGSVGEVATVRQAHGQDGLAGLDEGAVRREVGARAAVRLEVGMLCAEELLGALDTDDLRLVDLGAATVVALAGVTLGVLIAQGRAESSQHGRRREVFARDELQALAGTLQLGQQDAGDLGILRLQLPEVRAPERLAHRALPSLRRISTVWGECTCASGLRPIDHSAGQPAVSESTRSGQISLSAARV